MKTTLFTFLLFLSVNLMGQIDPRMEAFLDTAAYEISEAHEFGLEGIIFTNKDYINAKIDKRIMELWKEYQVECWNDSTLLKHQHYMPEGEKYCIVDYECLNTNHYKDYWVHKDPNNLTDFMLFIERKITDK
jgi:hypothetical protein